jgi:adenylate kinase
MKIAVILGAPGSGKGTVAARLVKKLPLRHVSTGDLLRAAAKNADTPAKKAVAETMRKGELVSDEIVGALVVEQLSTCSEEYMLLDGYPRNENQAAFLEKELAAKGMSVTKAVWLEVPEEVLVSRLSGRRTCPACGAGFHVDTMKPKVDGVCDACGAALVQRPDDQPANVANRLKVYAAQTAPLLGWYEARGVLSKINGVGDADAIADAVAEAVRA